MCVVSFRLYNRALKIAWFAPTLVASSVSVYVGVIGFLLYD